MKNIIVYLSLASLTITNFCYFIQLMVKKKDYNFLEKIGKNSLRLSGLSLSLFLINRWWEYKYFPLSNLYESLIFLSCLLCGFSLWIDQINRFSATLINPIILSLSLFANFILPQSLQEANKLVPSLQSDWLMFHVSAMIISYASLICGSLFSIFLLMLKFLEKKEKNGEKPKDLIYENLDKFSYKIIGIGFALLTLGIIAGAVWANEAWGSYWSWDPKETWSLITWLIFASYLHARIVKKWEKEKVAIIASIGFLVIWICYLGVNFLAKGLHSYGWLA
jgi:cytochrome c-type biogenesis protein CcsB